MSACPYVERTFQILGKKWSAIIIHYVYGCDDHQTNFTDIKHNITNITPRALSLRLSELIDYNILVHDTYQGLPTYRLTRQGIELAEAFTPIQKWGTRYLKAAN